MLRGAAKLIGKFHPKMVIEVNREALRRQGSTPEHIFRWLEDAGYTFEIIQENCVIESPLYDILCSCNKSPEVPSSVNGEADLTRCTSSPPPVRPPLTPYGEMIAAVVFLKKFAETDTNHRQRVIQNLSANGLTPRWPRRKKKKNEHAQDPDHPAKTKAPAKGTGVTEG
jgi:hypothetical protein